jgi:ketosteroid isomerase-like protein
MDAADLLQHMAREIDGQNWEGLAELLADDFVARYPATGEVFDATTFVVLNREYPGSWQFQLEDLVAAGDRAVSRSTVTEADRIGGETHVVASFVTARDGRIAELVEVWSEVVEPPADRRPPR